MSFYDNRQKTKNPTYRKQACLPFLVRCFWLDHHKMFVFIWRLCFTILVLIICSYLVRIITNAFQFVLSFSVCMLNTIWKFGTPARILSILCHAFCFPFDLLSQQFNEIPIFIRSKMGWLISSLWDTVRDDSDLIIRENSPEISHTISIDSVERPNISNQHWTHSQLKGDMCVALPNFSFLFRHDNHVNLPSSCNFSIGPSIYTTI